MRSLMFVALLAMPSVALGQSKPLVVELQVDDEKPAASKTSDTDRKLAQLEERLQAMIKEIHSLRGGDSGAKVAVKTEKTSEKQAKRFVVQDLVVPKPVVKTEIKDVVVQVVPEGKHAGEKSEPKTIVVQAQPPGNLHGTIQLKVDDVQIQKALQAEKAEKHAGDVRSLQLNGKMLLLTDDGKTVSPGTIEIHGLETKPGEHAHAVGVAKPGEKKMVARVLPGSEGKWVIEMVEDKPGEQPKVVVFGDEKDSNRTTKVIRNVQTYAVEGKGLANPTSDDSNVVNLTRATYHLNQARARALDSFLRDNAKARVLETKVEGDNLIVTTTPDVQRTIGQVVNLMSDNSVRTTFQFQTSVAPEFRYKLESQPKPTPKKVDREDD